jgi:hypothetical protein
MVQLGSDSAVYAGRMMRCAYCGHEATMKIPANPEHVCSDHAVEFWTGLLVYSSDRSRDPVTHEPVSKRLRYYVGPIRIAS